MKCRVIVSLKKSVFDPQGSAIERSLRTLGADFVAAVRQGKVFEITLHDGLERELAEAKVRQIAKDVLANPVIEEFHIEFVEI